MADSPLVLSKIYTLDILNTDQFTLSFVSIYGLLMDKLLFIARQFVQGH